MTTPGEFQVRPVITVPPRVAAGMADAMVSPTVEASVNRRWGIIDNINANGTLNVNIGGVVINNIPRTATYNPRVGERVQIDVIGTDMVIVGPTYPSPRNQSINERAATITSINSNGTLGIRLDDSTVVTAYRLVSYFPVLNETVRVLQVGSTTDYLVIGNVANAPQQNRMPTGDIEMTIRKTPKPNTLLLDGSLVSRTTYAALWAWAQAQALVIPGLFTTGDGSTTFGLPDFRGRVPRGVAPTGEAVGFNAGADTRALVADNMPAHTHSVAVAAHAAHTHTATTSNNGDHSHGFNTAGSGHGHSLPVDFTGNGTGHGHNARAGRVAEGPSDGGAGADAGTDSDGWHGHGGGTGGGGGHTHSLTTATGGPTTHAVTETQVGKATPFDVRQASVGVNYLIWI